VLQIIFVEVRVCFGQNFTAKGIQVKYQLEYILNLSSPFSQIIRNQFSIDIAWY